MRSLGQIDGRKPTERFVAYLLTLKIKTHIEGIDEQADRWEVWIRNEDQMAIARKELDEFLANPNDARYDAAMKEATRILEAEQRARQAAAKNVRRMETSGGSRLTGGRTPPLTLTLCILAVIVSLLSGFMTPRENNKWGQTIINELSFVEPSALASSKGDPAASLKRGELWRVITPIFMHGSPLHLAMNILLLVSLGRLTERIQGTQKYALFILMLAVFPNLLQGLSPEWMRGSPNFVGISGRRLWVVWLYLDSIHAPSRNGNRDPHADGGDLCRHDRARIGGRNNGCSSRLATCRPLPSWRIASWNCRRLCIRTEIENDILKCSTFGVIRCRAW